MDTNVIRSRVLMALTNCYRKVEINQLDVDSSWIRENNRYEFARCKLYAIEFFGDGHHRFIMIYLYDEDSGRWCFSRPKTGILQELVMEIRYGDFRFDLHERFTDANDVMGRFLVVAINARAESDLNKIMRDLIKSYDADEDDFNYTVAYKVIKPNKNNMGYTAIFQIHYKRESESSWKWVKGRITSGVIEYIHDENERIVSLADLF